MAKKPWQFLSWREEVFRFFAPYVKPELPRLAVLCLAGLVSTAIGAGSIWVFGQAVSQVAASNFDALYQTLFILAAIMLVSQAIGIGTLFIRQRVTLNFVDRVRRQLLSHIMSLSFPATQHIAKGDFLSRLSGDVDRLLPYVINAPLNMFSSSIIVLGYGTMLVWIDAQLALTALAVAPLAFLSQRLAAPRVGIASRELTTNRAELFSIEEQTLSHLRGISAFGAEQQISEKHAKQFAIARDWAFKLRHIRALNNTFATILVFSAGIIVVVTGVSAIESGRLDIAELVSFLIYLRFMTHPIRNIAQIPVNLQNHRVSADRVMDVFRLAPAVEQTKDARDIVIAYGAIRLKHVSFNFPKQETLIFNDVCATIDSGETIALVGPSGAGKSTFANLLLRFYDPKNGAIEIDGHNLREFTLASLRAQISIVWQEPFLMNGTVRENMLLARDNASDVQIIAACKAGHCWDFIEKLTDVLDTPIGPNGTVLSVGQKQRIAIAQAFLRDTPILILDEASSALDSQSEEIITLALQSLRQNRTTLIIAHRYSSVRTADRVFYFNGDGTITVGTHVWLMENRTDYRQAVHWQTQHHNPDNNTHDRP